MAQADSAEQSLPTEWRLLWRADCQIRPRTVAAPEVGPAQACDIRYPVTVAEIASNLITVGFCRDTASVVLSAEYVLDLPAGSTGKLKVVALDPNDPDSSAVIESGEAAINGGIDGSFPMVVLRLKSDHATNQFRVDVVGSGLATAHAAKVATAAFQDVPLKMTVQDDSSFTAVANIPAALPEASLWVAGPEGSMASQPIPPDHLVQAALPDTAVYTDPDSTIYPKDFTLFYASTPIGGGVWQSLFHIFYIRACGTCADPDSTDKWLGHAWSRDLKNWNWNIHAFHVSDTIGHWDSKRIWAPSLVLTGTRFYLFYTGVDTLDDQTIGFASADNLDTLDAPSHWKREPQPVLAPDGSGWIKRAQPWQLRDPFVMPDPTSANTRYLMFFAARETTYYYDPDSIHYFNAVGLAKSDDNDITVWTHAGYYQSTDYTHTLAKRLESPHVFADAGHLPYSQQNAAYWRIMYTDGDWSDWKRAILFTQKRADDFSTPLADLNPGHWSAQPTELYTYLHLDTAAVEYGHQASEVMRFGNAWYWGAYDGEDLRFRKVVWEEPSRINFHLENVDVLAVEGVGAREAVRFGLVELIPGKGRARFRVELPGATRGTLAIYDVMGRRVRTLLDGQLSLGVSLVSWDGRSGHGIAVGSGVYFARLAVGRRSYVLRMPLIR